MEYRPEVAAQSRCGAAEQLLEGGPMRFNDDMIIMPLGTPPNGDALSHVYYGTGCTTTFPPTR